MYLKGVMTYFSFGFFFFNKGKIIGSMHACMENMSLSDQIVSEAIDVSQLFNYPILCSWQLKTH